MEDFIQIMGFGIPNGLELLVVRYADIGFEVMRRESEIKLKVLVTKYLFCFSYNWVCEVGMKFDHGLRAYIISLNQGY